MRVAFAAFKIKFRSIAARRSVSQLKLSVILFMCECSAVSSRKTCLSNLARDGDEDRTAKYTAGSAVLRIAVNKL